MKNDKNILDLGLFFIVSGIKFKFNHMLEKKVFFGFKIL